MGSILRWDLGDPLDGPPRLHSTGPVDLGNTSRHRVRSEPGSAARRGSAAERSRQIRDGLAESDLFGALADGDLNALIRQGRVAAYGGGSVVFRKGDPAEDLMIVLCGRIRLSSTSSHGKEVLFDFIGPGRCFGEGALLDAKTRALEAMAVKPSAVFALHRRDVLACLERHPAVAVRIIRVLCARLSRAMQMFEDRTQLGLSSRTARALLRLAREYGSCEGDVVRIELKISQGEIAALVGATREKVNRQLCAWCRSGILAVDEGHLTIHRRDALESVAEERFLSSPAHRFSLASPPIFEHLREQPEASHS
jgi:CRP/FNR family transcriptional regulator, cyclic AMP receptor protein